jgi:hypothetical protein
MKLATTLTVLTLALTIAPARSQDLTVRSNGDDIIVFPRTPRERDLRLESKPPGQVEQPAPDDADLMIDEPDENLDNEALPPTPPVSPRQP